jgi:hypothetical protein
MKIIQLAIRTLCRFKIYTIINIIGLALSMASLLYSVMWNRSLL